ncbi:MAG: DNA replication protein [Alphaproteobacteria bacterium]|nr:DNA replication protein [Alphaproteobacteria bacterium]
MTQLIFDLARRTTYQRPDFLVSDCNRKAVEWIDRWPLWPSAAIVLHGPPGCGKTHLAHLWRQRAFATLLSGEALTEAVLPALLEHSLLRIAVDDADRASTRALLHIYNSCVERRGSLFFTARSEPDRWPSMLADLRSRLRAAIVVGVGVPDDALLGAVLAKHFAERQIRVSPGVIAYLISRMERSFAAAGLLAARLDDAALSAGTSVTVALARRILPELGHPPSPSGSESAVT